MKRRILHFFISLSLLVCVATAALWIRSSRAADLLVHMRSNSSQVFFSSAGDLGFELILESPNLERDARWSWERLGAGRPRLFAPAMGFSTRVEKVAGTTYQHYVGWLGDWLICLVTGILPVIHGIRWRRTKRRPDGVCQTCGYDLRATPERCPEMRNGEGDGVAEQSRLSNSMMRRLLNLLCLFSLLLFAAALSLSVWSEATSTYSVTFGHAGGHEYEVFELPPPWVLPTDFAILPLVWIVLHVSRRKKSRRGFPVVQG